MPVSMMNEVHCFHKKHIKKKCALFKEFCNCESCQLITKINDSKITDICLDFKNMSFETNTQKPQSEEFFDCEDNILCLYITHIYDANCYTGCNNCLSILAKCICNRCANYREKGFYI